jgi:MFS family permease
MGFGMLVGRAFVGMVADKLGAIQTFVMTMQIAGLLQIILWQFATNLPGVIAFSLVYGAFGGSGLSLIPVVTGQLFGVGPDFATLVGLGMLASAPGQLVGPTISGAILGATHHRWIGFQIFSGAMMCLGGLIAIYAWYRRIGLTFDSTRNARKQEKLLQSSVLVSARLLAE